MRKNIEFRLIFTKFIDPVDLKQPQIETGFL